MTIKVRLTAILIVMIILLATAITSQKIATNKNKHQTLSSDTRYLSYLIADEFRQSSIDLTRLCRLFVATGEQKYWDAYWHIVNWRNGEVERPNNVDNNLYPDQRIKQSNIMKELNFSANEFTLLEKANSYSNTLIATEEQAMQTIKNGKVAQGPFQKSPNESINDFALRLVFSDAYQQDVKKIMAPVNEFFNALDKRTADDLFHSQQEANFWLNNSLIVQVIVAIILFSLMFFMKVTLFKPLEHVINAMNNIGGGDGDLSQRLHEHGQDELSSLGKGFNLFASYIQTVVIELRSAIGEISSSSAQLNTTANLTEQSVTEQKIGIEQVLIAIEQMIPAVREVAINASQGLEQAKLSDEAAKEGLQVVDQANNNINLLEVDIDNASAVINKLAQDTNNIGSVLDVIRGIADQTNLLALNAAIEAARAGEQGRGFAVVADEVRTLAQRTQDSTSEIQQMIEKLQVGAKNAVNVIIQSKNRTTDCVENTGQAGHSLSKITSSVGEITDINSQIAAATEELNASIEEIRRTVDNINQHVERTAKGSQETANKSDYTTQLTSQMQLLIERFKTE